MTQNLDDLFKKFLGSFQFILLSIYFYIQKYFLVIERVLKSEIIVMYYLSSFCSPVSSDLWVFDLWVSLHVTGADVSRVILFVHGSFQFFCICACLDISVIYICAVFVHMSVKVCYGYLCLSVEIRSMSQIRSEYSPFYLFHLGSLCEPGTFMRVAASKPRESFCLYSLSAKLLGMHRTPSGLLPRCWDLNYNPHTSTSTLNHWAISPDAESFYYLWTETAFFFFIFWPHRPK